MTLADAIALANRGETEGRTWLSVYRNRRDADLSPCMERGLLAAFPE